MYYKTTGVHLPKQIQLEMLHKIKAYWKRWKKKTREYNYSLDVPNGLRWSLKFKLFEKWFTITQTIVFVRHVSHQKKSFFFFGVRSVQKKLWINIQEGKGGEKKMKISEGLPQKGSLDPSTSVCRDISMTRADNGPRGRVLSFSTQQLWYPKSLHAFSITTAKGRGSLCSGSFFSNPAFFNLYCYIWIYKTLKFFWYYNIKKKEENHLQCTVTYYTRGRLEIYTKKIQAPLILNSQNINFYYFTTRA